MLPRLGRTPAFMVISAAGWVGSLTLVTVAPA
jgi:hypothetical protein